MADSQIGRPYLGDVLRAAREELESCDDCRAEMVDRWNGSLEGLSSGFAEQCGVALRQFSASGGDARRSAIKVVVDRLAAAIITEHIAGYEAGWRARGLLSEGRNV